MTRAKVDPRGLAEDLERNRVVGWIDTPFHDVHRKIRMLVGGDPSVQFGLGALLPASVDEVVGALNELSGWDFAQGGEGTRGRTWVSPERAVAQVSSAAERLALACERGERVFFGTGHPTGPLEMYTRLADALRERGAEVKRIAEGESFDGYIGGGRIQYVCDVACVSMSGDVVHTHSAKPMEFLFGQGLGADLVIGDHGFTGAALAKGIDAVAIVDTNDPALALAWRRGLPVRPVLCDDNRPAAAYQAMTDFIIGRL
jgi:hypothetical protein